MFVHECQGDHIPLILRHRDVRAAAKDWERYSSDSPFRVPIPSEEGMRQYRQIPIELDPPLHTTYRKLIEPWFLRPTRADYQARIDALVSAMLEDAVGQGEIEVTSELALPMQSRALAILLGVEDDQADRWIQWGNSLFREGDGFAKGAQLDDYLAEQFARARSDPDAEDFFAFLVRAELDGRPLSDDELYGIANLVFAGGRDTVINSIAEILAHCSQHPDLLDQLAAYPRMVNSAVEEFIRFLSPLSFIGRVCPQASNVQRVPVEADGRIGLCWASANNDEAVFDDPASLQLDRKPNPHMGFGSGRHACLGAAHARVVLRCLLQQLSLRRMALDLITERLAFEHFGLIRRQIGYERLVIAFYAAK